MNTNQVSLALAVALVNRTGYNEIGSVSSHECFCLDVYFLMVCMLDPFLCCLWNETAYNMAEHRILLLL